MIRELDTVVLTTDLAEHGLEAGDTGTLALIHENDEAFKVEFVILDGETIAVTTRRASQVRPIDRVEIASAREPVPH